ncbi:MAG TPA: outer membrane beta-barrel protein [Bdellovibrio sp.]|uniref:outer membrane beta-barrel protein n=1 Tax=Bdellovibrio sp. TaxID=28201 RepID=UPI002F0C3F66
MKNLFFAFLMLLGLSAHAQETAPEANPSRWHFLEVALGVGSTRHSGYLSDKRTSGDFDLSLHYYTPGDRGFWEIFIAGTKTEAGSDFSLPEGKDIKIGIVGIGPNILFHPSDAWNIGIGVGFANVSVNGDDPSDNSRTFGTFYWSGQVHYVLNDHWKLFYLTRWMNTTEKYNGSTTFWEMWTNNLGVSYRF